MDLRLTLIDPQRAGASAELAVRAPNGTRLDAVAGQLATAAGIAGPEPSGAWPGPELRGALEFHCDGRPIGPGAVLGLPPLLHGAVLTLRPGRAAGRQLPGGGPPFSADTATDSVLEAHVVAGPDAGAVVPLTPGRHAIGRGSGNSIQIVDPEVSREHAELLVAGAQIILRDSGSTCGTSVGDQPVDRSGRPVAVDDEVRLGASRVAVRTPDRPPAALTLDGEGHIRINRSPQLRPARGEHEIRFPGGAGQRPGPRFPWPAMVLPLVLAVGMSMLWHQPSFALFALMTPVMMAGQYIADRRSSDRSGSRTSALRRAAAQRSQAALDLAVAQDAAFLEQERPDLARLAVTARIPTDELWRRSPGGSGFLQLRLGRGPEAGRVLVHRPSDDEPAGQQEARAFIHPDVPVAVDLGEIGVLGVCGSRPRVIALARALVGQLAVLHSPEQVRIALIAAEPSAQRDWRWLHWLPHYRPTVDFERAPSGRRTAAGQIDDDPVPTEGSPSPLVVVLDGAHALRQRPEVAVLLAEAGDGSGTGPRPSRVLLICLDQSEQDLPAQCRSTVILPAVDEAADGPNSALVRRARATAVRFNPDLAGARWAERLSRHLAPYREAGAGPEHGLPDTVRLIELLAGPDVAADDRVQSSDPVDLARHWRRPGSSQPCAVLGRSVDAGYRIDLRRDGPHLLIGGTTGAGKSELLQTLVTSLAVGSAPDQVSFLLVDYKGGAALRECATLPHVAGIITDLDPQLARRAMTSLTAELRRRERLLNTVQAADIDAYAAVRARRTCPDPSDPSPGMPALPRLVVVVDEFRVLAEELPEFVSGLIRTATVGRSLGVHLVLATQRPAGVVSAEIAANVNLRIALRVRDRADSLDLIDDPAAARIPGDRPGRALARTGAGPLLTFQTARVSGRAPTAEDERPTVRRLDPDGLRPERSHPEADVTAGTEADGGVSDLAAIAVAASRAATLMRIEPVVSPWLPPLPGVVELEQVLLLEPERLPAENAQAARTTGLRLPYGIVDLPDEQRQQPVAWQLSGSNLAVAGGPRSGRTTTLITLARSAALVDPRRPVHLYALDGAGGLAQLSALANVDAVVPVHDPERAGRLLRRLAAEITGRQGAAAPFSSDVVLIVDGWEATTSAWNEVDHGRMLDELLGVLRDGPAVGVYTVVSGGRSLLTGAVSSLLSERVVLRFADPSDALLAGVPASRVLGRQPPGRGIVLNPDRPGGSELQVAVTRQAQAQLAAEAELATAVGRSERAGWRIPELPRRLDYRRLLIAWRAPAVDTVEEPGGQRIVPIGIGGDNAEALGLDLDESPGALVVGPAGSGRTSTLRCIAAGLLSLGRPVIAVRTRGGEWPVTDPAEKELAVNGLAVNGLVVIDGRAPDAGGRLSLALSRWPEATVLVDDLQSVGAGRPDGPAEQLGEVLAGHPGGIVAAAKAPDLLAAYRGVLALARTAGAGVMLGAVAPGEGDVLGVRLGRQPAGPPGRALLIRSGQISTVQLALPPDFASIAEGNAEVHGTATPVTAC